MNVVYKLAIRLDLANPRDKEIFNFLSHYPPRHKGKRDFILDALYGSITMEFFNDMRCMTKEIENNLKRVASEVRVISRSSEVSEEKPLVFMREENKERVAKKHISNMDLGGVLSKLQEQAFN